MSYKKVMIFIFVLLIIVNINSVFSLKILEPVYKDLKNTDVVDLGFGSPGESFLISFLNEKGEDYFDIKIFSTQEKDVIIENIQKTKESIFTTIKFSNNLPTGEYKLNLILVGKEINKNITLKLNITEKVIYTTLNNFEETGYYNKTKEIKFNVINKATTTKTIIITSDLSDYWFNKESKKVKKVYLDPNSIKEVSYEIIPQKVGTTNFKIYIISVIDEKNLFLDTKNYITYDLKVNTQKSITSIYGSKEHTFPLFNSNLLPIYFFNKIIKLI